MTCLYGRSFQPFDRSFYEQIKVEINKIIRKRSKFYGGRKRKKI